MDLVLEKVSKITSASLTTRNNFFSTNSSLLLIAYNMVLKQVKSLNAFGGWAVVPGKFIAFYDCCKYVNILYYHSLYMAGDGHAISVSETKEKTLTLVMFDPPPPPRWMKFEIILPSYKINYN